VARLLRRPLLVARWRDAERRLCVFQQCKHGLGRGAGRVVLADGQAGGAGARRLHWDAQGSHFLHDSHLLVARVDGQLQDLWVGGG
jgi:hypothetical protein